MLLLDNVRDSGMMAFKVEVRRSDDSTEIL
jgi:hypothetical protein